MKIVHYLSHSFKKLFDVSSQQTKRSLNKSSFSMFWQKGNFMLPFAVNVMLKISNVALETPPASWLYFSTYFESLYVVNITYTLHRAFGWTFTSSTIPPRPCNDSILSFWGILESKHELVKYYKNTFNNMGGLKLQPCPSFKIIANKKNCKKI